MLRSVFLSVLALLASSVTGLAADRPSVHGMLLVGQSRLWLSHLPMFHRPHDYQLIAQAEVDASTQALYLADKKKNPGQTVYTIVPEPFSLPEMARAPKPFRASLYRGHFERGGVLLSDQAQIVFRSVIHFRQLNPQAPESGAAQFIAFGQGPEQFVANLIGGNPDFDQVAAVRITGLARPGAIIRFKNIPSDKPLQAGSLLEGLKGEKAQVLRNLYLEFDDLSM